jgi:hypothetical protein
MRVTLVLLTYARGRLMFGKSHSTFCFGTAHLEEARGVEGPETSFSAPWCDAPCHPPPYSAMLFEGENIYGITTSKPGDDTALRGCALSVPPISVVSFAHSPSTGTPLQPLPQMTITTFVRDMVLKAIPKKSTRSPTHTLPSKLIRPVPDEILNWTGSCQEERKTRTAVRGQYPLLSPWPARWWQLELSCSGPKSSVGRPEIALFYILR